MLRLLLKLASIILIIFGGLNFLLVRGAPPPLPGQYLVVHEVVTGEGGDVAFGHLVDLTTGEASPMFFEFGMATNPGCSADGHWLVFTAGGELYRLHLPTGDLTRIPTEPPMPINDMSISNDGQRILGSSRSFTSSPDLAFIDVETGSIAWVTQTENTTEGSQHLTADGTRLVFASNANQANGPDWDVFLMIAGQTTQHLILEHAAGPEWIFGDTGVVYVDLAEEASDIAVLDLAHRFLANVTDNPFNEFAPTWSPDRRALAFGRYVDNGSAIVLLDTGTWTETIIEPDVVNGVPACFLIARPDMLLDVERKG
jgi:Tol biopolymer transport system component